MTELRRLEGEEMLDVMFPLGMYAFRASPPFPDREEWVQYARQRKNATYYSISENGEALTGAGSTPLKQNVRGAIYPTSAVWGVVTHPNARRKGYCKQTLAALLANNHADGQVFSTLYPFRESFYERMGYVTFPMTLKAELDPRALTPFLAKDLGGEVVFKPFSEVYDLYRAYLYRMQADVHGLSVFDQSTPYVATRRPMWAALAYVNGGLDGIMLYTLTGEEITNFTLKAERFYYRTNRGRSLLLAWVARHVDQAGQAILSLAPYERPETWLVDIRAKVTGIDHPIPMGRVLDVAGIGGMQTGPGSFSAQIRDPFCPWNEGCWRFETQAGKLQVSKSDQAECELSIQALSALAYGTLPPQDFWLRGWGDPVAELIERMGAMFPLKLPHLHEMF